VNKPVDLWPNAFLHTLNPFAIRFTETFGIRWYGLAYLAGFLCGYWFILRLARRGKTQLPESLASDFVFCVALGTVIGGRLGYCFLYSPELITKFTASFPFWGVLAINEGGMASHGGILGIIIACILFGRKHSVKPLALFDLTTIGGAIGIFFGRIANFINGELFGRVAPPNFQFAVKFPQEILVWPYTEPEKLSALAPAVNALGMKEDRWNQLVEQATVRGNPSNIMADTLQQLVDEVQRGNLIVRANIAPVLSGRHPSQLYEGLLEGLLILVSLLWIWRKPRSPGVIGAAFLVIYPVVRIIGEQFRVPDLQIGFQWLGLTRGQWLSVIMLIASAIFLRYCLKQSANKQEGS
jgi:phosphatidylglycerol---prolipoprotein diacylglyceryl transferase